ncbi:50S ribosomal protein L11 methyltransferase [Kitasatospora sp. NPDC059646]|uniref:50S ribosomal protein L11 methyltransferase n=1 Tax=Kitasatospora sp. NPDC059646 TaxID=3346893 RepID=UPI003677791F
MDWTKHARGLAEQTTDPDSRWRHPVSEVARHLLVPKWWEPAEAGGWRLIDGMKDPDLWHSRAYGHQSMVTSVGGLHADHATPDDNPAGRPTSSATLTALVVKMLRHARIGDDHTLLDVGTGAGGLTAIASIRLGDRRVTSIDVDEYLTRAARDRLDEEMGLRPQFLTVDATGPIPGTYDRLVATVAARPIPASWLQALRPGGRLVTTIADTALILTAWKDRDGGATGVIERDWAGFMTTRHGPDYPPGLDGIFKTAREADGEHVAAYRYPVADIRNSWEIWSMLTITTPGIEIDFDERPGRRTAYLAHPDGSWARAEAERFEPPTVHQAGPRRLWDGLERIRNWHAVEGGLPLYGCPAKIDPDGRIHLSRGRWSATID